MLREIFLAFRYLFRGKARHVSFVGMVAVLGVALGVATVIVAVSIINGIDGNLLERVMKFQYHITLDSTDWQELYRLRESLAAREGIEEASLSVRTQVFADISGTIVPLVVRGFDLEGDFRDSFFSQYIEEEFFDSGFFIGRGLSRRFFFKEDIEFYPLDEKLVLKKEKIRGYFETGLYDVDNYYLITDLNRAKSLSSHYHLFLGLRISKPFQAGRLAQEIEAKAPGALITTWTQSNRELFAALRLQKLALLIILSLIILIASFNIFATLTIKVAEKTKDIGILKSIGFTSRRILSVFMLQGLILGVLGALLGVVLGLSFCHLIERYPLIELPQEIFFTRYLPVAVNYYEVALIAKIAVLISFVSGFLPAKRACRLCPTEALRYE